MIPQLDAEALLNPSHKMHDEALKLAKIGASDTGFITVYNTPITGERVENVISVYREFFKLSTEKKQPFDMARTGSNRGWGAPGSEQVNPDANPDYKQFFDSGLELANDDPIHSLKLPSYALTPWPAVPDQFAPTLKDYFGEATRFALDLLVSFLDAIGEDGAYFRDKFTHPMALLRGNFYPERPNWAGAKDFGIATHTDYGCLTLLATDGSPGLEVRKRGGGWIPVESPPGSFVINFGEMMQMWTNKRIVATPHRVKGTPHERISVPLFFNPTYDTNVAPLGSGEVIRAVDHLQKRFNETYVHLNADNNG